MTTFHTFNRYFRYSSMQDVCQTSPYQSHVTSNSCKTQLGRMRCMVKCTPIKSCNYFVGLRPPFIIALPYDHLHPSHRQQFAIKTLVAKQRPTIIIITIETDMNNWYFLNWVAWECWLKAPQLSFCNYFIDQWPTLIVNLPCVHPHVQCHPIARQQQTSDHIMVTSRALIQ